MSAPSTAVVLGGTFDPIHAGHLAVLDQVRRALDAGEAWLIPTALPPHRRPAYASVDDRLAMVRAAAEGHPGVRVLDIEARRPGPSYTIDTFNELLRRFSQTTPWFILGADAARDIGHWHRAADLLQRANFVIVNRSGVPSLNETEARALGFVPERTRVLHVDSPDVSATEIRRRVAAGQTFGGMVTPAVERVIAERGLYRAGGNRVG